MGFIWSTSRTSGYHMRLIRNRTRAIWMNIWMTWDVCSSEAQYKKRAMVIMRHLSVWYIPHLVSEFEIPLECAYQTFLQLSQTESNLQIVGLLDSQPSQPLALSVQNVIWSGFSSLSSNLCYLRLLFLFSKRKRSPLESYSFAIMFHLLHAVQFG